MFKRILSIALVMSVTACASLAHSSFGTPVVTLKDVRMKGIGIVGGSLDVMLDVYNPNNYRLDTGGFSYTLWVDTLNIASGQVTKLVTLESRKTTGVTLPLSFTIQELQRALKALTATGSVPFRIAGRLTVATPAGSFTRPYEGKGVFNSATLIPH
jgi:LEA14-like dessication related protein